MERDTIISKINEFLVDEFEIDETAIRPDALLMDDLGIESLDFVDIVVIIEKDFGFKVEREQMIEVKTLVNLYDYIEKHVE